MKKKIQMSLDDIIFEHRNKAYGAYVLRQEYRANLTKASLIGSLSILAVFMSSFVAFRLNPPEEKAKPKGITVELNKIREDLPDLPIEKKVEPPKQILQKQVKFPPQMVTVKNEEPENEQGVPDEKELEISAIGNEYIDGPPVEGSFTAPGPVETTGDFTAPDPPKPVKVQEEVLIISEVMPEFEGGMSKMYKWLGKNLRYPTAASNNGIEGRVVISFIVEKDGGISNVEILKGIGFGCDEEAARVVEAMPKWKAGEQNGRPVRVKYTLPLTFKIN